MLDLEVKVRQAVESCGYRNMREVWHKVKGGEKPAADGEYLGLFCYEGERYYFQVLRYFARTESFNRDLGDDESLEIFPDYWCEISDIVPSGRG